MNKAFARLTYISWILITLAFFYFYFFYQINLNKHHSECYFFTIQESDIANNKLWSKLAFFIGAYIFIHAAAIAFMRVQSLKVLPYEGEEPRMILCLNRIIGNTIQQTVIFVCLLYSTIQNPPFEWPDSYYVQFARFFIYGRVLFSAGYIIGQLLQFPYIRSIGLAMTIFPTLNILLSYSGVNIFSFVSSILVK